MSTLTKKNRIKRGDDVVLLLDTKVDISGYTSCQVFIKGLEQDLITIVATPPVSGTVQSVHLSPAETAETGLYVLELQYLPGPHTFPTDRYLEFEIVDDLAD